jgi:hypothetical protein
MIFFPFKFVIFLYSIFIYKFFNIKNSKKNYLFFIYLFCITGGWINSLVTVILSKKKISFKYNEDARFSDFYTINSNQIAFIKNNQSVKKTLIKDEDILLKKSIKKILKLSFFDKSLSSKLINF